jgi:hypothetical protein
MTCKDFCLKYPNCFKYKLVRNQKGFKGEVEICSEPEVLKSSEWEKEECEWKPFSKWVAETTCGHDNAIKPHQYKSFKVCPYCAKPIKIKELS